MIKKYCDVCKAEEDAKRCREVIPIEDAIKMMVDGSSIDYVSTSVAKELRADYKDICSKCLDRIRDNMKAYGRHIAITLISAPPR